MKDISVQVVKVSDAYQITVIDDEKTSSNEQGWKCNTSESKAGDKKAMLEEVRKILDRIE